MVRLGKRDGETGEEGTMTCIANIRRGGVESRKECRNCVRSYIYTVHVIEESLNCATLFDQMLSSFSFLETNTCTCTKLYDLQCT